MCYHRPVMEEKFKNWNEWKDNRCFRGDVMDSAYYDMKTLDAAMDKAIEKMSDSIMATFGKIYGIEGDEGREETRKAVQNRVRDAVDRWLYNDYLCVDE